VGILYYRSVAPKIIRLLKLYGHMSERLVLYRVYYRRRADNEK